MTSHPLHKVSIAEAFGTFWIVFAGTGAILVNELTGGISHMGVAVTLGLVVFTLISALGDISAAHFNPAVTLGFYFARRFPITKVGPYTARQFAGGILASTCLYLLFPAHTTQGATISAGAASQSWLLEVILPLGLMFVILGVSTGAKERGITAALAIGSIVALEALFAGPISGASMNPARSLAPALLSGHINDLWIYLSAPVIGAIAAVFRCACARENEFCSHPLEMTL